MKKSLLLFLCVIPLFAMGGGQMYAVDLIPEELMENAVAIIREDSREYRVTGRSRMQIEVKRAITILEARGLAHADITIQYNSFSRVSNVKGTLYDSRGNKIRDLNRREFADRSFQPGYSVYNDTRVIETDIYSNQYPFTVVYEYTITLSVQKLNFVWTPVRSLEIAVEKANLIIDVPDNLGFRFRGVNIDQAEPEITTGHRNRKQYSWTVEGLPAKIRESWMPRARHIMPYVMISPNEFVYGGYDGSLESWESFGQWIGKLNHNRQNLNQATINRARELTAHLPDTLDKIRAIYRHVQSSTRYVAISLGIGGLQPSAAIEVARNGYGDCKDLSNYTMALLQAIGINSYYTLIQSGSEFLPVQRDFPANFFNHAILCVPIGGDTIWLETTAQTIPAGYIGRSNMNRYVLLITPEKGVLTRTPPLLQKDNQVSQHTTARLSWSGDIEVSMQKTFTETAIEERFSLLNAGETRQRNWFRENASINQLTLKDLSYSLKEQDGFSITEKADFSATSYARVAGNRLILQPLLMHYNINPPTSSGERINDFQVLQGHLYSDSISWQLPPEFTITHLPDNVTLDTPYGEYKLEYHYNEASNILMVYRTFALRYGLFDAIEFADFTNFLTTVHQNDRNNIMLQKR